MGLWAIEPHGALGMLPCGTLNAKGLQGVLHKRYTWLVEVESACALCLQLLDSRSDKFRLGCNRVTHSFLWARAQDCEMFEVSCGRGTLSCPGASDSMTSVRSQSAGTSSTRVDPKSKLWLTSNRSCLSEALSRGSGWRVSLGEGNDAKDNISFVTDLPMLLAHRAFSTSVPGVLTCHQFTSDDWSVVVQGWRNSISEFML